MPENLSFKLDLMLIHHVWPLFWTTQRNDVVWRGSQMPGWISAMDVPKELKSDAVVPWWITRYSWSRGSLLEIRIHLWMKMLSVEGRAGFLLCDQTIHASTERCLLIRRKVGPILLCAAVRSFRPPRGFQWILTGLGKFRKSLASKKNILFTLQVPSIWTVLLSEFIMKRKTHLFFFLPQNQRKWLWQRAFALRTPKQATMHY